jgi:hypothetical protein
VVEVLPASRHLFMPCLQKALPFSTGKASAALAPPDHKPSVLIIIGFPEALSDVGPGSICDRIIETIFFNLITILGLIA